MELKSVRGENASLDAAVNNGDVRLKKSEKKVGEKELNAI